MTEIWKTLPGWIRYIVVPIIALIVAWAIVSAVIGAIFGLMWFIFGWVIKALVIVALGAVVVILVKKASR
ncbi:hypothetical protein GXW83_00310 [Streptacidiphilus sp. PB12-B1b]|uniref:DUF5326 family protein n=1 Tax=Streptacidiphilus sp. PB12-B1b TaxID=2705012 RepID=UPI0015FC9CE4|nr:DUF5326 family protein [Streptacidiphilus sp. PB12-B1b]QMU74463.1 hypothetical protein GXW83_00310 [Streptacidiphilus sp. PB12-B1b]